MSPDAVLGFFGWEIHLGAHAYALIFLCAFATGILFNLTPCVFPVLPLKIYGFYETAQHDRGKCLALGAVFSLGVVAAFGVLALLVVALGKLQWGEQFSKAWFTLGVVVILVVLGVAMMRDWSVVLPAGLYDLAPRHDTMTGNFLMGILATILSTPCTAPMFVGLTAWAATQPRILGVGMMLTVGVGMAFPYLLLSAFPNMARNLPRGGPGERWSNRSWDFPCWRWRRILPWPGSPPVIAGGSAESAWEAGGHSGWFLASSRPDVYGWRVRGLQLSRSGKGITTSLGIALVLGAAGFWLIRPLTDQILWQPYTQATFAQARASGNVVLVEFTAFWCGNCQALEATVFHDPRVKDAIARDGVVPCAPT